MKCENCPLTVFNVEGDCLAEKTGHYRFCTKINPKEPDYDVRYIPIILKDAAPGHLIFRSDTVTTQTEIRTPNLFNKVKSFVFAVAQFILSGFKAASPEVYLHRINTCKNCSLLDNKTCRACGCLVALKARLPLEKCPLNYWEKGLPILPIVIENKSTITPPNSCSCGS